MFRARICFLIVISNYSLYATDIKKGLYASYTFLGHNVDLLMCIKIVEHALFRFTLDSFVLTSACSTTEIVSHDVVFCVKKLFMSHILTSYQNLFPALLLFSLHILVLYIFIHLSLLGRPRSFHICSLFFIYLCHLFLHHSYVICFLQLFSLLFSSPFSSLIVTTHLPHHSHRSHLQCTIET